MAVIDTGSSVAGKANVTSNFQLEVHTPAVKEQAGFVGLAGIVDDGSLLGTPRVNRAYVSEAGRLAVAQSVALWEDDITVNAQNTAKYTAALTTYAATWTGGFLTLNSSGITTASSTATVSTYRSFPMFGRADLKVSTRALMTATPQAHTVYEIGLGKASGITAPTDGVFFRYNAVGELRGVINAGGVETQTAAMTQPSINVVHDYTIVVGDKVTLFFIDDVLAGKIVT